MIELSTTTMEEKLKQIIKLEIYDQFKCSADQCPFTCCEDWEIDIDPETYRKWEEHIDLSKTLPKKVRTKKSKHGTQHYIRMNSRKICPYLNSNQLCTLVIDHGEDYIPRTCKTFPRTINKSDKLQELSLSCACPEVVDLLRDIDQTVGFLDGNSKELQGVNGLDSELQVAMIVLFRNQGRSLHSRIFLAFHMLWSVKSAQEKQSEILEKYESEQYLIQIEELWKDNDCLQDQRFGEDSFIELSELFLDIAENYRKQPKYRGKLEGIAKLAESLLEGRSQRSLTDYAEEYRTSFLNFLIQYEQLLANCMITKLFANCYSKNVDDMILAYQIIITEYLLIKYSAFLNYKLLMDNTADLYPILRDYIVVYSRIIEYNAEGMKQFWSESFDKAIWEMGYVFLLLS